MGFRPVIGITGAYNEENHRLSLNERYFEAVMRAGGLPIMLPQTSDEEMILAMLDQIDGLLLSGGVDVHPNRYGEETLEACGTICEKRDVFELLITKHALERNMPIFGICRGTQVLGVAMGATLFQDIESQLGLPAKQHKQEEPYDDPVHTVRFKEGGLFERITETTLMPTNSMHHQSIKEAGDRLRIEGITMDGIIEAVCSKENEAVFGVQFHPEFLSHYSDFAARLFTYFVGKAADYHQ